MAKSESVNEDWILSDPGPIVEFTSELFKQVPLPNKMDRLAGPVAMLSHGVCGTEIEAQEISLGMLFVPYQKNLKSMWEEAAISRSVCGKWTRHIKGRDILAFDKKALRKIIRMVRDEILGWAPGIYEHPFLVFTYDERDPSRYIRLFGVFILSCAPSTVDTGRAYLEISKGNNLAAWIKPHGTVRFYHGGQFLGHIVKLRDTNSWALRSLSHLHCYLRSKHPLAALKGGIPPVFGEIATVQGELDTVIFPLLAVSEEKKGAALYVVHRSWFLAERNDLFRRRDGGRGGKDGARPRNRSNVRLASVRHIVWSNDNDTDYKAASALRELRPMSQVARVPKSRTCPLVRC
jgi:hypothetical protein